MNVLNFLVNGSILYGPFAGCFESLLALNAGGSFILFCVSFVSHMVGKGLPTNDKVKKTCWEVSPECGGLQPEAPKRAATCQVPFLILTHLIFMSTL